jgi:hypothetical protein
VTAHRPAAEMDPATAPGRGKLAVSDPSTSSTRPGDRIIRRGVQSEPRTDNHAAT